MTIPGLHTIEFGGESISFLITRTSRRKTVSISVGYDGVKVLAPADLNDDHILGVVRKRGAWVLRKQAAYRDLGGEMVVREYVSGETYHYLGRPYRLKVMPDTNTIVSRVALRGGHLLAPVPAGVNPTISRAAVRSGLQLWYRDRSKVHFPTRARAMARLLDIPVPIVQVVDQSKRWGSCDARGRIRLNWRLVMAPMSLIDYVVAHEACHVLEHSHSPGFWRLLETIMPDYRVRVHRLNQLGHLFVW